MLLAGVPAAAGEWEVEPFIGVRVGGSVEEVDTNFIVSFSPGATVGVTVGRRTRGDGWLAGTWSRQFTNLDGREADLHIDHLHFTGAYEPNIDRKLSGYVLASAGVTRLALDGPGGNSELGISVGAGGGARFALGHGTSLKLEARGWVVLGSGQLAGFCAGGCVFVFSGSGVFQLELSTGVAFAF
jgi:hypothetical protein